jgi:HEAT repeat protein
MIPILLLVAAQTSPSWDDALAEFRRLLKSPEPSQRVAAPRALIPSADPRAVEQLVGLIGTVRARELEQEGRLQLHGRHLNELYERYKILDPTGLVRPGRTQAKPPEVLKAEMERRRLEEALAAERDLLRASVAALSELFRDHLKGEAADKAVAAVAERAQQKTSVETRLPYVDALGGLPPGRAVGTLTQLAEKESEPEIRAAAVGALRRQADGKARAAALPVVVGRLKDPSWQVKVAAATALRSLKERSAVPALIEMLANDAGRLKEDALAALREISGQDLGANAVVWREWWEREQRQGPAAGAAAPPSAPRPRPSTSFYGIETLSERILFVVDKSYSMNEPAGDPRFTGSAAGAKTKMEVARHELLQAISPLTEKASFNIVFYHHEVAPWRKAMSRATAETKAAARAFIDATPADGNTNIFDALEKAFALAGRGSFDKPYDVTVDTIFLMTDGKPNRGRIVEPETILDEVRRLNSLRRIKIHCIGIGDHDKKFMETLARENGGAYVSR